jgi:hypothetical protein
MREFSPDDKLNHFKVDKDSVYYLMPDQEFVVSNDSDSEFVMFLAKPDI